MGNFAKKILGRFKIECYYEVVFATSKQNGLYFFLFFINLNVIQFDCSDKNYWKLLQNLDKGKIWSEHKFSHFNKW